MFDPYLTAGVVSAAGLGIYHHAVFPAAMALLGAKPAANVNAVADFDLPSLTIVAPAFNEADHIAAKIDCIASTDYPAAKLSVLIGCDGCTDGTADIAARQAALYPELDIHIVEFTENRGKTAVLNDLMRRVTSEVTIFTDVSATFDADALRRLAARFADPRMGAVGGGYALSDRCSAGQRLYWRYQTAIKQGENHLAGLMGAHGALYGIRTHLFTPLPMDSINDDFIIPVRIAIAGHRTCYDPTVRIREAEVVTDKGDGLRRRRIGAGNLQQAVRMLPGVLRSADPGLIFAFLSGKCLRVLMGPLIVLAFFCLVLLSAQTLWGPLLVLAAGGLAMKAPILRFVLNGHLQSMLGAFRYLVGGYRRWHRIGAHPS
ncbi:MAG: glycosyltransferase family 2 protein [Alphaproteobacteria bacterium]|nr:glycosyltransferase family 2 protein [Alphaproteobacteria bacterium]